MSSRAVSYLVFDIESIADGNLISKVRYPDQNYSAEKAIEVFCSERMEQYGTEFIPYTYHIPVSIAIIKVTVDFKIDDIVTLDAPQFRPHIITKHFWDGWKAYKMPTFVSFNGRTFDIPLMEMSAFRYGLSIPAWFNLQDRTYDQKRNRFNQSSHIDLQEVITNYGATRLSGGLNLVANILGKPGKMGIAGHMVQDLYNEGELDRINDYCRCDVLDTYFVLLRTKVLTGEISLDQEQALVADAMQWLEIRSDEFPVYGEYIQQCSTWSNPWNESEEDDTDSASDSENDSETPDAKPVEDVATDQSNSVSAAKGDPAAPKDK
jgi:predicted PolB exonuclease-like 3'-5' exonuclease